jgi:hypothetical protein
LEPANFRVTAKFPHACPPADPNRHPDSLAAPLYSGSLPLNPAPFCQPLHSENEVEWSITLPLHGIS